MLEGAFTILATDVRQPDIVVGARHDSPLVVGLGDGENFLGSDVAAFVAYTKRAMEIDQDQAVMVSADKVVVSDFMGNIVEHRRPTPWIGMPRLPTKAAGTPSWTRRSTSSTGGRAAHPAGTPRQGWQHQP